MDFCKESNMYISLYLDELLDDKSRIEFLNHIEGCSQCSVKLKETSYFADLCREDQDIQLPEDFSSSLHKRLLKISTKDSKIKFGVFGYNKKFITGFSTAAILAISLLAYNLLPQMGLSKDATSMANEKARIETSNDVSDVYSGSSEVKSSRQAGATNDGTISNTKASASASTEASTEASTAASTAVSTAAADTQVTTRDVDVTIKFNKASSIEEPENNLQARIYQDKVETSANSDEASKKKENDTNYYNFSEVTKVDTNKYFSHYAELNLKVSPERIEIENLRKFMNEMGAIELKPATINGVVEKSVESTLEVPTTTAITTSPQNPLQNSEYIEYYLPLSIYSILESQATKYKIELSQKTDIIDNDITEKYNVLNNQRVEIDKRIEETVKKRENTSTLEAEKLEITQELNKLIAEKEMITVRIFL